MVLTSNLDHFALFQFDPGSEADRLLLIKVILHAADIGNAIRPFQVNDTMSKR